MQLSTLVAGTRAEGKTKTFIAHATTWNALVDDALRLSRDETRSPRPRSTMACATSTPARSRPQTSAGSPDEVVALQNEVRAETNATVAGVAARATSTSRLLLIVMVVAQLLALLTAVDHAQRAPGARPDGSPTPWTRTAWYFGSCRCWSGIEADIAGGARGRGQRTLRPELPPLLRLGMLRTGAETPRATARLCCCARRGRRDHAA